MHFLSDGVKVYRRYEFTIMTVSITAQTSTLSLLEILYWIPWWDTNSDQTQNGYHETKRILIERRMNNMRWHELWSNKDLILWYERNSSKTEAEYHEMLRILIIQKRITLRWHDYDRTETKYHWMLWSNKILNLLYVP